jgi:exonuclease III
LDKLYAEDPDAKVLIMGDLNDDPTDSSLKNVLKSKARKADLVQGEIYNPMEDMFRRGFNTLVYRDNINLFDQILLSASLVSTKKEFETYKMYKAGIFNPQYLTTQTGKYKGYPFRSFASGRFIGGYSDHYPVYIQLIKNAE